MDGIDRRGFIGAAGMGIAGASVVGLGSAADAANGATSGPHELPDLPYGYEALEPHYDKETLTIHHDKHHAGYVKGLNSTEAALKAALDAGDFSQSKVLCKAAAFHGSGHILHSLFWGNMKPGGGGEPSGGLAAGISRSFGSFEKFKGLFLAAANSVEGSGWGILAHRGLDDRLVVLQAEKHENLTQWGVSPILVVDVWEHAYYLKYQNRRKDWTATFMDQLVNWDNVAANLDAVRG